MKKWIITVLVLSAGIAQAAVQNNVWTGQGDDNDFNYSSNWWNSVTANDIAFFRGDFVEAFPARANADLSADVTITGIKFQCNVLSNAAYNITGSAGTLTLDGNLESQTTLIEVFNTALADQTIAADLVLSTWNNANNAHIKTGTGAGLILSGTVTQNAASSGVGIKIGNGDIEMSGNVNGSGKNWKIHDNGGGSGLLKLTGNGIWSGFGTVQISSGVEVLLNRSTTNSTAFAPGVLQVQGGGTLSLGNDEQMTDTLDLTLGDNSAFKLDGHTETIRGLNFLNAANAAVVDMGSGGILHLASQNSAATWGALAIGNWVSGANHIYVDGGSFSAAQLATITFEGWSPAGAKVEGGELLPTGTSASAYESWASKFGVGSETNDDDNDGLLNVYEYGLGGDPTNAADQGISPSYSVGGGILTYVYPQRSDPNHGLDYHLETRDDLVAGGWTNSGYAVTGTNIVVGDFDYVTNEVSTAVKAKQFIELVIDTL